MEIINENSALLTNYEVYGLLTDIQNGHGHKKPNKHQQNLATIVYETVKYLENTSCKLQDPHLLKVFSEKVQKYNLTKAEKLQLLNHRPTTAVEIQLIVEESEERLTEEQIYELLELIASCVPCLETENGDEENNGSDKEQDDDDLINNTIEGDDMEEEEVNCEDELITEDRNDVHVGEEDNDDND